MDGLVILVKDNSEPDLLVFIETQKDFKDLDKMVQNMNKDLVDSGFDKYQFKAECKGKKAYIRRL